MSICAIENAILGDWEHNFVKQNCIHCLPYVILGILGAMVLSLKILKDWRTVMFQE